MQFCLLTKENNKVEMRDLKNSQIYVIIELNQLENKNRERPLQSFFEAEPILDTNKFYAQFIIYSIF